MDLDPDGVARLLANPDQLVEAMSAGTPTAYFAWEVLENFILSPPEPTKSSGGVCGRKSVIPKFNSRSNRLNNDSYVDWLFGLNCSAEEFRSICRIDKGLFLEIEKDLSVVLDAKEKKRQRPDSKSTRDIIVYALHRLGTRGEVEKIAIMHGVSPQTISNAFDRFCDAFVKTYTSRLLKERLSKSDLASKARGFLHSRGIPGAIGAVDGKHFRVIAGRNADSLWKCHKGYRSINVVGVVDSSYRFMFISPPFKGSSHDSSVFKSGWMYKQMKEEPQLFVPQTPLTLNIGLRLSLSFPFFYVSSFIFYY
jgi:hypothetical protein